ncbi:single-stranded DNA-binding protein [Microbacterium abyssi]|uniref:single-stranded DNA-binding protein n=1 Tax=Microbacterium abyssi TaxID=2782166 RepID=UPI001886B794|nr:single-stranded DNA-binding protein [Microbacterium sp. A18JL241]
MNDTVTILGRVGGDPNRSETTTGVPVVNFRVASPQRRFDQKTQTWIETGTNWYNVSAFRQLAEHAKASLHSGDGVIVTGRLKLREWESGGKKGLSADIDADAIGHDLRWGASAFAKARTATPSQAPVDVDAEPHQGPEADVDDAPFSGASASASLPEPALAGDAWRTGD